LAATDPPREHVILCGLDGLGFRTLEELHRLGEAVVVVAARPEEGFAAEARALGARLIEGNYRLESVLREAGVAGASALVITEDDDVGNLHAALAARELNSELRIILRMFNLDFGRRIQTLLGNATVLSSSALAAPAFVSAVVEREGESRFQVAGRVLALRSCPASAPEVLAPLARAAAEGEVIPFPEGEGDALCLVDLGPAAPRLGRAGRRPARDLLLRLPSVLNVVDRRLRAALLVLVALAIFSALVFYVFAGLDPIDAIYFTVTVITTTGFGDINLREAPAALKLYGAGLMLFGATMLAIVYAFITDTIVGARLARALGGPPRHLRDHVVVCGLGSIGYRVVAELAGLGIPLVAVEVDESDRFIAPVRRLGVPVLLADARLPETLAALQVAHARCLVAGTNNDLVNLETALSAHDLNARIRIVLRLFDPDLAGRVERTFGVHLSRSVSALAAPAFAAAATGQQVLTTLPIAGHVFTIAALRVAAGSAAIGRPLGALGDSVPSRVLCRTTAAGTAIWKPAAGDSAAPGDELIVVATHAGLAEVRRRVEVGEARK
jgi:Trk K+ transport system NAD-binding subunit